MVAIKPSKTDYNNKNSRKKKNEKRKNTFYALSISANGR